VVRARFSMPVQTGPEAHPAYCTLGSGSFLGAKWPGRDAKQPLPSRAKVENLLELYLRFPFVPA